MFSWPQGNPKLTNFGRNAHSRLFKAGEICPEYIFKAGEICPEYVFKVVVSSNPEYASTDCDSAHTKASIRQGFQLS